MSTEYSGTGDPARSLALLWRTRDRGSRKGGADLSVDRIVRAAVDIADAEGLAALSMRRVAQALGAGTMSLYTHVPGKGELLDLMLDTVHGELTHPDGDGGWRDRLTQVAHARWRLYQRHPWLLQVATTRPALGPHVIATYEHELRAVDGIGLTDLEMDAVLTLVTGYVHGAVRTAVEAAQAAGRTGLTEQQWWQAHAPYLERALDPRRFPLAARVGTAAGQQYQGATDPTGAFAFGLARILDGIQVLVTDRASDTPGAPAPHTGDR
ncbi:TetR/AcrR family transcriptional regulator C-terminal domain-containing protein [Micromonospora sp. WMMD1082]|uniref:TetR/AcrR family transcriptional regulator C-terminal domain-containing protein n=1 Tax=Micromonospora sp. WMMD1082 TaxID=3016104 RepID=UPI002416343A|nr:TetR/AcrR family transcriptional regulator C-terminal domain-containing protein [Micromonospora sp. WMMD1082]MDG4797690.1 TetR/AcrR family transcriptional regulator C-terminal domain-containing protein [Micromonospora sp. WMMD1082]